MYLEIHLRISKMESISKHGTNLMLFCCCCNNKKVWHAYKTKFMTEKNGFYGFVYNTIDFGVWIHRIWMNDSWNSKVPLMNWVFKEPIFFNYINSRKGFFCTIFMWYVLNWKISPYLFIWANCKGITHSSRATKFFLVLVILSPKFGHLFYKWTWMTKITE